MSPAAPVLIARDDEVGALRGHLAATVEHGPGLVLVTGPHGVGLTHLVAHVASTHRGRCLRATAVPWEQGEDRAVLAQLLGRSVTGVGPLEAARDVAEALQPDATADPTLVWVDDAQHSDPTSLQVLSSAVRHHPRGRFLVVLSGVLGDRAAAAAGLHALAHTATQVDVAPLATDDVQALTAAYGVPLHPTLAERLRHHTGGRPGPVVELVTGLPRHTWADREARLPAPATVAADVAHRLAGAAPSTRALLEAVAVLGEDVPVPQAVTLAGVEDPLAVLDDAARTGLLRGGGTWTRASLRDPMVAAAVLDTLGPQRLAARHRAAAGIVEDPAARLGHLVAATPLPDPSLAGELEALAEQRAAGGEWATAAELLARAARLTDDGRRREDLLARSVDALVGAGDTRGAAAMAPEVESLRETPLRNEVLGYLAVVRGRPGEAEKLLTRAWDLVNAEREPEVAAQICQRWVLHHLARCRGADLVTWADRAVGLAPEDSPAAVEAVAVRGLGVAGAGRPQEALAGYLALAEEVGHGAQAQRVAMGRGWLHLMLDEVDSARAALASALPTDYLGGSARISLWAHGWLARAQFAAGDWDEALVTARDGLALVDRTGMRLVGPLLAWTVAQVHALRGEWAQAERAVHTGDAGPRDYEIMRVPSCLARAAVAEARADYAGVLRALEPLRQPWAGGGIDEPGAWPWADVYANALVLQGCHEEAEEFLRPHERLAEQRGHRSARARLGYARGRLLGATGDLAAARSCFEDALALLADLPLRHDRARGSFAYGQTLRRAGKRAEADAVLQTARDLYLGLGATTYVERCDRELRAGGVHLVRGEREVDELTPQERLVSALVARGMTNREVATELFVSVKTVQYHLTRIYAKLGIRSRSELAALRGPTSGD